jgi:hypothetical protein
MSDALHVIPDRALDEPVSGVNLVPGSLRDQLGDEPVLLIFLRFFGCIFCREMVSDLRALSEQSEEFPPVLFFHQGTPTEGRAFLRRYWPGVRAVADPEAYFYEAFGVRRASLFEALGPGVFSARRRAVSKGNEAGDRSHDIWRMPGVFLVRGPEVIWQHDFRHAGELPDFSALPEIARGAATEAPA